MDKDLEKIKKPKSKDFRLESITQANFRPHPYMIGPRHVGYASDHWGGMLGDATIREAEKLGIRCAFKCCDVSYEDHKSDKVLFIKALVDKPIKDLKDLKKYLLSIKDTMVKMGIDGVAFIEPDKKS